METYYIQIPTDKRKFFLDLMKELNFVKISESSDISKLSEEEYIKAILESEADIKNGKVISHKDLKKEVQTWFK